LYIERKPFMLIQENPYYERLSESLMSSFSNPLSPPFVKGEEKTLLPFSKGEIERGLLYFFGSINLMLTFCARGRPSVALYIETVSQYILW